MALSLAHELAGAFGGVVDGGGGMSLGEEIGYEERYEVYDESLQLELGGSGNAGSGGGDGGGAVGRPLWNRTLSPVSEAPHDGQIADHDTDRNSLHDSNHDADHADASDLVSSPALDTFPSPALDTFPYPADLGTFPTAYPATQATRAEGDGEPPLLALQKHLSSTARFLAALRRAAESGEGDRGSALEGRLAAHLERLNASERAREEQIRWLGVVEREIWGVAVGRGGGGGGHERGHGVGGGTGQSRYGHGWGGGRGDVVGEQLGDEVGEGLGDGLGEGLTGHGRDQADPRNTYPNVVRAGEEEEDNVEVSEEVVEGDSPGWTGEQPRLATGMVPTVVLSDDDVPLSPVPAGDSPPFRSYLHSPLGSEQYPHTTTFSAIAISPSPPSDSPYATHRAPETPISRTMAISHTPPASYTTPIPYATPISHAALGIIDATASLVASLSGVQAASTAVSSSVGSTARALRGVRAGLDTFREREVLVAAAKRGVEEWEASRLRRGLGGGLVLGTSGSGSGSGDKDGGAGAGVSAGVSADASVNAGGGVSVGAGVNAGAGAGTVTGGAAGIGHSLEQECKAFQSVLDTCQRRLEEIMQSGAAIAVS